MTTVDSTVRSAGAPSAPIAHEPTRPGTALPTPSLEDAPRIDVPGLQDALLGRWADVRRQARALATREDLQKIEGQPWGEHRERVLGQLHTLVTENAVHRAFPKRLGGEENHGGNIAGFEELVVADPSLQIKAGVQWGLFGSAVMHLGTDAHHDAWLPGIMDMTIPGAFAMTETGHGSDVASIATTATYDPATEEFDLHTPFRAAWKDYLGNAALHGKAAVVFAQLVTGGVSHGVHAFYVPIRDEQGAFLAGIGGEDDGHKGGLNGIDNGRLHFTHVRVPRFNLLDRYGAVTAEGAYSSPIASPGRRFFTMLGTLVQGRVSLDGASVAASKVALQIAVTYADQRRQFSTGGGEEEVLLDYQQHQRRLITRIARTYAGSFAHEELLAKFDDVFSGAHDTDEDRQDLETLAAAFKALSTWNALDTLQEAREACGGAGFLSANRLTGLRADLDVYATFEGDNTVLLQLVAKRLLTDYAKDFRGIDFGAMARYAVGQAADRTFSRSGLRQAVQFLSDRGDERVAVNALREEDAQRALLSGRVEDMVAEVAQQLRAARKLPAEKAASVFNSHQHELIEAARAHAELLQWEAFSRALATIEDPATHTVLTWVRDLFGLTLIEENLGWYLMHGRISMQRARTLPGYVNRLLARLRPHARDLVDAFGYEQAHLRAAISSGAEADRQDEARAHQRRARANGDAPVDEKVLYARAAGKRSA